MSGRRRIHSPPAQNLGGGGGGGYDVIEAARRNLYEFFRGLHPDERTAQAQSRHACAARPGERIKDDISLIRAGTQAAFNQRNRFLCGVLAMPFLSTPCGPKPPDGLHLFAAILGAHLVIVERVAVLAALGGLARPQNNLRGVGERAAS